MDHGSGLECRTKCAGRGRGGGLVGGHGEAAVRGTLPGAAAANAAGKQAVDNRQDTPAHGPETSSLQQGQNGQVETVVL